uniref:THAP4-like heme-binding beta-barrel domain-containing protein n=1 Tax=Ditylenchus dipsaci TaxID=166011 RepID=A0A915E9S1_9BILA
MDLKCIYCCINSKHNFRVSVLLCRSECELQRLVISDRSQCELADFVKQACLKSCGICDHIPPKFDVRLLPDNSKPLEWLLGIWRSESGVKVEEIQSTLAIFPTIPTFTYGEQIEISIASSALVSNHAPSFNYTTFAWSMDKQRDELHSEHGFITVKQGGSTAALTTVMSNGFVTVEEGLISNRKIRFRLVDIGRISFSRDLPVHDLVREWSLLDRNTLEARLSMETLTHGMREHTTVVYTKAYP